MAKPLSLLISFFLVFSSFGARITIIESSLSINWAVQDTVWKHVATGMGHQAVVVTQDQLSSIANFTSTDVLIVASATQLVNSPANIQTLKQFIQSGRPVYIQSEYLASAAGNILFDTLMKFVGADFSWGPNQITGQLTPMQVSGTFSNTPNPVAPLTYFNAGHPGDGTGVEKFLEFNGNFYGFCYTDLTMQYGSIVTTSDQDWIWHNESPALLENILHRLVVSAPTGVQPKSSSVEALVFPNPTAGYVQLPPGFEKERFSVVDRIGQPVLSGNVPEQGRIDLHPLVPGVYTVRVGEKRTVRIVKR